MAQGTELEVVAAVVVGVFSIVGVRRGFILATLDLLILVAALAVAGRLYRPGGAALAAAAGWSLDVAEAISFALIFVVAEIVRVGASSILRHADQSGRSTRSPSTTYLDQLAGLLPGALRGLVGLVAVVVAMQSLAVAGPLQPTVSSSPLGGLVWGAIHNLGLGDTTEGSALAVASPAPGDALVGEAVSAPYPPGSNLGPDAAAEQQVIQMTNLARFQAGLAPLQVDPRLAPLARQHAGEMLDLGYFGHDSPMQGSLAERARRAGVVYREVAENVAYASTVSGAFQALMASPPHRQNLLSPALGRIGVGVARSSQGDFAITQDFAN